MSKKPMDYFTYCTRWYSTKNKLEKEVIDFLRNTQNRRLVTAAELKEYKSTIDVAIDWCNTKHARCKALKPEWWKPNNTDWQLMLPCCVIMLYAVDSSNEE